MMMYINRESYFKGNVTIAYNEVIIAIRFLVMPL